MHKMTTLTCHKTSIQSTHNITCSKNEHQEKHITIYDIMRTMHKAWNSYQKSGSDERKWDRLFHGQVFPHWCGRELPLFYHRKTHAAKIKNRLSTVATVNYEDSRSDSSFSLFLCNKKLGEENSHVRIGT